MRAYRLPGEVGVNAVRVLAALAVALPLAVQASSDPFFDDIPLVLTATRLAQSPLDAPAAVTVIDREMIEASGFTRIHDLLRLVPGFLVADVASGSPTVASHGLGDAYDRRVKVMIDGRTINSPLWGDTKWDGLPLRVDDIERLEVVRGPNGAAYGVNAFQGVINIISRSPATEVGKAVILRAGKDGFHDYGVRINGNGAGVLDWRLSASRRSAVNFEPHLESRPGFQRWHDAEKITRTVANFSATLHATGRDQLALQFGVSEGPSWRGSPDYVDFPPHVERDRSLYLQAGWVRQLDAERSLSLQYYHQSEREQGRWTVGPFVYDGVSYRFDADRDSEVRRDDLELQYSTRLSSSLSGMLGLGVRAERARSFSLLGRRDWLDATHGQLFGNLEWQPLAALRINLGGTLEHHDYSGRLFSPRFAANYALDDFSALRLSAGRAYRAPSLMESRAFQTYREGDVIRRILYRAQGSLQSERMRFIDLGYVAQYAPLGITLDTRVFREYHERFIDDRSCRTFIDGFDFDELPAEYREFWRAETCAGAEGPDFQPIVPGQKAFYFFNGNDFRMTGAEFTVDWRRAGWGRIVLSQAFVRIDKGEPYTDRDIPDSAPHATTSVLLIKDLPDRWRASIGYYRNGEYYWMNGGDYIPRGDRFDLKLARRFGAPGSESEFSVTALSATGKYPDFHNGKYRHQPFLFATLRLGW